MFFSVERNAYSTVLISAPSVPGLYVIRVNTDVASILTLKSSSGSHIFGDDEVEDFVSWLRVKSDFLNKVISFSPRIAKFGLDSAFNPSPVLLRENKLLGSSNSILDSM
jgi:hypothetical protein